MPTTIAQDLEAARKRIADLEAAAVTLDEGMKALQVELATSVSALAKARAELAAATESHKTALAEVAGKLAAEETAHGVTRTALAEATMKLADPAYQMAVPGGKPDAVGDGGQAATPQATMTKADAEKAYAMIPGNTIEGARARAEFRAKHKDILGL